MNPKVYWIAGGVAIVGLAAWYFWPQIRAKLYGSEGSFDMGWLNKRYNALYSERPPPKPPVKLYVPRDNKALGSLSSGYVNS